MSHETIGQQGQPGISSKPWFPFAVLGGALALLFTVKPRKRKVKRRKRNPGAQVHEESARFWRGRSIDPKLSMPARRLADNRWPIEKSWAIESKRLGIPNPKRRRRR